MHVKPHVMADRMRHVGVHTARSSFAQDAFGDRFQRARPRAVQPSPWFSGSDRSFWARTTRSCSRRCPLAEPACHGYRPRHIGSVARILRPGIDEQQLAVPHCRVVALVVQNRRVRTGSGYRRKTPGARSPPETPRPRIRPPPTSLSRPARQLATPQGRQPPVTSTAFRINAISPRDLTARIRARGPRTSRATFAPAASCRRSMAARSRGPPGPTAPCAPCPASLPRSRSNARNSPRRLPASRTSWNPSLDAPSTPRDGPDHLAATPLRVGRKTPLDTPLPP